jgi:aryl carrier-like protein
MNLKLQQEMLKEISKLASRQVEVEENLLDGAIDSLSWIRLIVFISEHARRAGIRIDFDELTRGHNLSVNKIVQALTVCEK